MGVERQRSRLASRVVEQVMEAVARLARWNPVRHASREGL